MVLSIPQLQHKAMEHKNIPGDINLHLEDLTSTSAQECREFLQLVAFLWALQLLSVVEGSMVQLNSGGYENIVIAINPRLAEDQRIIESIKKMTKEASTYLFHATKKHVFIRSAKILIPLTWNPKPDYLPVKTESYDKADVIVAEPFLKYGDDPYTLQYGGCGEKGKYIHFTPKFLIDDSLLNVYGSRGRVFVHEWSHLRWGVFDEYNSEKPFYVSSANQREAEVVVEATRCSANITGIYVPKDCTDASCLSKTCNYNQSTGLYEEGCTFIPNKIQTTTASIMYMQALSEVVEFCDDRTHNPDAPNLHNRMCKAQSTWDVIKMSPDLKNPPLTGTNPPSEPVFSLLQIRDRVVCLVLDVSGSMSSSNRIGRLRQAAELFLLQIIEADSHVGIVTFHSSASIRSSLRQIDSDATRKHLVTLLPTTANGGTNICAGLRSGFEVNKVKYGNTYGSEIVLLTDGEDTGIRNCFTEVQNSGAIIHTIALGPNADKGLEQLSTMTGGLQFAATDSLDSNGLIDAFTGITSGSGNFSQQSIQLESSGLRITPNQCFGGRVTIDNTVGNDTFFVVTWEASIPNIQVEDPIRKIYSNAHFTNDPTTKTARLQITGTAQAGDWIYNLCNKHTLTQVLSMTVTSRPAIPDVPPVTVNAHMNKDTNNFPNPMVVYAEVSQGFLPVLGANVTAIIEPAVGNPVTLELDDNGAGADIAKNDGIYSKYFTAYSGNGRYNLKVRVQGKDKITKRGFRLQHHALYIPGYVENGKIQMNPTRPTVSDDDIQVNLGSFSRTASGGSFVVANVPAGPLPDVFPPSDTTDLEANIAENNIVLSWTAPGDNLDVGQAARYDIRMSENRLQLKDHFENATAINTSSLKPQPAGSSETFSFTPDNLVLKNGTKIYFALRAFDSSNLPSGTSNTAMAALFIPPTPVPTTAPVQITTHDPSTAPVQTTTHDPSTAPVQTTTHDPSTSAGPEKSPAFSVTVVVLIVCATAIIVSLISSITICIVSGNKKKRKPETGF
ncbi:calcium-activated chloride channel regulator 1 [Microcaecilia unicolor]|uniref:Calcium-activated chloride channel regulator 1-like n=1 Tax=Microcaecilia unicolor TaxID=1415580 RepID=A0A6P7YHT0_9AMPH|nr:calcium-activated chloride channel regulator 1-like [Microcaecilia unicolor]